MDVETIMTKMSLYSHMQKAFNTSHLALKVYPRVYILQIYYNHISVI